MARAKHSKIEALKQEALKQQPILEETKIPAADEPTDKELLEAALNAPSEIKCKLGNEEFALVELGFLRSRVYLQAILPTIENTLKDMAPLINAVSNSWFYLKNFTPANIETLRLTVLQEGVENAVLKQVFENYGLPNLDETVIESIRDSALDSAMFNNTLSQLFMKPLFNALRNLSVSDMIMNTVDKLPELVLASFEASLKARNEEYDKNSLAQTIEDKMDIFDMVGVVQGQIQLYIDRGKITSFFDQIKRMLKMKNLAKVG